MKRYKHKPTGSIYILKQDNCLFPEIPHGEDGYLPVLIPLYIVTNGSDWEEIKERKTEDLEKEIEVLKIKLNISERRLEVEKELREQQKRIYEEASMYLNMKC